MTDLAALAAYDEDRDADAFRHLVLTYQGMVYHACRRVLDNPADAEDAAQETFLKLAKNAGSIRKNPASWLYVCATRIAHNAREAEQARQARQAAWAQMNQIKSPDNWEELVPVVDDCIADLPDDDRELLLQYYFVGRTQADLAGERNISQPAVKKRLDRIVDELRKRLRRMGWAVPAALLAAFLSERTAEAAVPAALSQSLCKIGLAGIGKTAAAGAASAAASSAAAAGFLGTLGGKIAAAVIAGAIAVGGVVAYKQVTRPAGTGKEDTMADKNAKAVGSAEKPEPGNFKHGFRYDPMEWIENNKSVQAAQVRTLILKTPQPEDRETLRGEIDKILAEQKEDGSFGDDRIAGRLIRLLRLGCQADRPEFRRAVEAMCRRQLKNEGYLRGYELQVAASTGWENTHELTRSAGKLSDDVMKLDFWSGCPWTGEVHVQNLWAARNAADAGPAITRGLNVIRDSVKNGRGWTVFLDPWGFLDCAGYVDHPVAKEILVEQIPMILRAQEPDGGWGGTKHLGWGPGGKSFTVLRALAKWGLLEELRKLPPLPDDWQVTRSIPLPAGDFFTMTWDGERFWAYEKNANEAVALSPQNGKVLKRLTLPAGIYGIGWYDGSLAVVRTDPQSALLIDPQSGAIKQEIPLAVWGDVTAVTQLGEQLCVANGDQGGVHFVRNGNVINEHTMQLGGPLVTDMTAAGDTIWHVDQWAPAIIQSGLDERGQLLDWGDKPFGSATVGIAFDGENLWVLDNKNKRICIIEKAGAANDRPEGAADDRILRCVETSLQDDMPIHILTWKEETAERLARSLADKFGPERVSLAGRQPQALPTTEIVVSEVANMCFVYLRAEMRGPEECAKAERMLKKTKVLVVNVLAEHRLAPCNISGMKDGRQQLLASIMLDDFFRKYRVWIEMETHAKRDGGRVVIEGVPTLSWEKNGQCTFAGALESALTVTDHPYTYAELMGWSGLAFRFRWYHGDVGQRWCASSAVGEFAEEKDAIEKATGWKLRWYFDDAGSAAERLIAEVLTSIDAGRPVLTYEPGLNVAVIYGYNDNGATLLLRDYFKGDAPQELPPADLPMFLCFLEDYGKPMARRDAFIQALKIAVRNWRRGPMVREKGRYFYGDAGFAKWIEDLSDEALTQEELEQVLNPFVFISLSDARGAAVTFLRDGAAMFEGEARGALMRATELYQQESKLPRFNPPNDPKKLRKALIEARKLDAAAIAEIEKALGLLQ